MNTSYDNKLIINLSNTKFQGIVIKGTQFWKILPQTK